MESVNVLVTSVLDDECLKQIAAVSPRVQMTDVAELSRAAHNGDLVAQARLDALLAEAEVIYGIRLPDNVFSRAPRLKWIQVLSAGVDFFLNAEMLASPVILTNVSGIHATAISEFVLARMLMFAKQASWSFQLQREKRWERFTISVLRSKTVGVVGLGNIGREVARLSQAFGMQVLATRRSAKQVGRARYVDMLLPSAQLPRLLAESDFVVITAAFTNETNKLIGEKELRMMKPTAYLINIARGGLVDEEALIRALEEHWIAGAALDVFATEPLPAESRLWDLPDLIFSPHSSGGMEDYNQRATDLFCDNLRRYVDGQKLRNVVDKKRGY